MRREKDELARAKKAAEDAALAKSGEIAIVRANQTKTEKFFESKIQALQKFHQDEAAKHRLEVERALAEKQQIATEKGFLQNDIVEGNQQIKTLQRAVRAREVASKNVATDDLERTALPATPKKNKSASHADGFDDHEMQPVSPSRLPYRSKTLTPKAGSKRKRKPVNASPAKPLQLSQANKAPEALDTSDDIQEQSFADSITAPTIPPAVDKFLPIVPVDERFQVRY